MDDVKPQICSLLDGLYSAEVIDNVARIGAHYLNGRQEHPTYEDVPKDLHMFTEARQMSDTTVPAPTGYESQVLSDLGILRENGTIKGAFNHIMTRMLTIPMVLGGYVKNWPSEAEIEIFTDPPLLQRDKEYVARAHDRYFAQAGDKLASKEELARRFAMLGCKPTTANASCARCSSQDLSVAWTSPLARPSSGSTVEKPSSSASPASARQPTVAPVCPG